MWTLFNIGYYLALPAFGYAINYDTSPVIIMAYYMLCACITIAYFWKTYHSWFRLDSRVFWYAVLSLSLSTILWIFVYLFSFFPTLHGPTVSTYTDIIRATPWYFLPKSMEILVQQLLVSVLVIELYEHYKSLKAVIIGYAICFGGAHIILFFFNHSSAQYSTIMTTGAFLSSFIFPYLMLKIRGGFVYTYALHFAFYIALAAIFHAFPPPGYII